MLSWDSASKLVLKKLQEAGYEAFIVGGAIRDSFLDRPMRDIDISTNAPIDQLTYLFPRIIDVGIEHGTVIIPIEGRAIEVTQFRKKDTTQPASIHTDLSLRDFTCNAIAMDLDGNIIDPFHGKQDIEDKKLRVVGNSPERFLEDPIRLLRGIRFAIQLGFSIDKTTEQWMREQASLIVRPAVERVAIELEKIAVNSLNKSEFLMLLENEIMTELPHLFPMGYEFMKKLTHIAGSFTVKGTMELWSFLAYSGDIEVTKKILDYYKLPSMLKKDVLVIVSSVQQAEDWNNYDLYQLGLKRIVAAENLAAVLNGRTQTVEKLTIQYEELPIKSRKDLAITGIDLITWFPNKSGLWIGNCLKAVEEAVLLKNLPNQGQRIYDWVLKEYEG